MARSNRLFSLVSIAVIGCFLGSPVQAGNQFQPTLVTEVPSRTTVLISSHADGTQGDGISWEPTISADGQYIAYTSYASNLIEGDSNDDGDVFLYNTQTGARSRVSVASDGSQANGNSWNPAISSTGQYVSFESVANNLVSGDTNAVRDIFLHDTISGQTTRVSVNSSGTQGNGNSEGSDISSNGQYIAFSSSATNLVSGDTNNYQDIFWHDRATGITRRVSVASDSTQANDRSEDPKLSADGRYVSFTSYASNLVSGDNNDRWDVFIHDTQTGETIQASVSSDGTGGTAGSGDASLSGDGRYIVFYSESNNLVPDDNNFRVDVFLRDLQTGETRLISISSDGTQGNGNSRQCIISTNGRFVIFESLADNLVIGDNNSVKDIFLHDLQNGTTTLISAADNGTPGNARSDLPYISGDGGFAVYFSEASNLVLNDNNGFIDVFVKNLAYFNDVSPSYWAHYYIGAISNAGLTSGYPDGSYRPGNPVTRAEMAVFLINALGLDPLSPSGTSPFSDISGHWAEGYILQLEDQGITGGYPDGTFRPESLVTRAEMAVFLTNALGLGPLTPSGPGPFPDIVGHWAEGFILQLYDQGITGGYPDGTYRPENQVTRAEMAVFLVNSFGIPLP